MNNNTEKKYTVQLSCSGWTSGGRIYGTSQIEITCDGQTVLSKTITGQPSASSTFTFTN